MRLQILESGHRPLQKAVLKFIKVVTEGHVPGPILVMSYRREFFGIYFRDCLQSAMRGKKSWSIGELELFATFVSKLNECDY